MIPLRIVAARPIRRIEVAVNNVPIDPDKTWSETAISKDINVELASGDNEIEVSGDSEDGHVFFPLFCDIYCVATNVARTVYFAGIGVTDYADAALGRLFFPASDAQLLAKSLCPEFQPRYKSLVLTNGQVTSGWTDQVGAFLRQSRVNDLAIVYLAGHGLVDRGEYLFCTSDTTLDNPREHGTSYQELESMWRGVRARQRVMLMDTCDSGPESLRLQRTNLLSARSLSYFASLGGVRGEDETNRPVAASEDSPLDAEFADVHRSTGATVIAASGSPAESAIENTGWKGGAFAKAALEALNGFAADLDGNLQITVSELRDYISARVLTLTQDRQLPTAVRENTRFDFPVLSAKMPDFMVHSTNYVEGEASFFRCIGVSRKGVVAIATMSRLLVLDSATRKLILDYYHDPAAKTDFPFQYLGIVVSENGETMACRHGDKAMLDVFNLKAPPGNHQPTFSLTWPSFSPVLDYEGKWICDRGSSGIIVHPCSPGGEPTRLDLPDGSQVWGIYSAPPVTAGFILLTSSGKAMRFDPQSQTFSLLSELEQQDRLTGTILSTDMTQERGYVGVRCAGPNDENEIVVWEVKTGHLVYQSMVTNTVCVITSEGPLALNAFAQQDLTGPPQSSPIFIQDLSSGLRTEITGWKGDRVLTAGRGRIYVSDERRAGMPAAKSGRTEMFQFRSISLKESKIEWLGVPLPLGVLALGADSQPLYIAQNGLILGWDGQVEY
jgi:hypothetical protein